MKRVCSIFVLVFISVLGLSYASEPFFSLPAGTVILDAGHGGKDPGAVSTVTRDGSTIEIYEKDITLSLVLQAGRMLEEMYPELSVIYCRTADDYISLWERSQTANSSPAVPGTSKLFVSVHVNAAGTETASGFEVWKLQTSIEKDFLTTTLSESGIVEKTEELNTSMNQELDAMASRLAQSMETALIYGLPPETRDRGIKEGSFYVLHNSLMPAILIETGFMTNKDELQKLLDPSYQETYARGIALGISTYIESLR